MMADLAPVGTATVLAGSEATAWWSGWSKLQHLIRDGRKTGGDFHKLISPLMFKSCKANLWNTSSLFKICSGGAKVSKPLVRHLLHADFPLLPPRGSLFPQVLCVSCVHTARHDKTSHSHNLPDLLPLLPISLILPAVRQKDPHLISGWTLHVLGHMFTQHAL